MKLPRTMHHYLVHPIYVTGTRKMRKEFSATKKMTKYIPRTGHFARTVKTHDLFRSSESYDWSILFAKQPQIILDRIERSYEIEHVLRAQTASFARYFPVPLCLLLRMQRSRIDITVICATEAPRDLSIGAQSTRSGVAADSRYRIPRMREEGW